MGRATKIFLNPYRTPSVEVGGKNKALPGIFQTFRGMKEEKLHQSSEIITEELLLT